MVDRVSSAVHAALDEKKMAPPPVTFRNRNGSGKLFLRATAMQDTKTSVGAKKILATLLGDDLLKPIDASDTLVLKRLSSPRIFGHSAKKRRVVDTSSMDHDTILRLAQDGQLSLLGSIMQMVKDSSTPVSGKDILKQCVLAVSAGSVPATMDAREYVLAAVHYLSADEGGESDAQSMGVSSKRLLPLLRVVDANDDLEKRSFGPVDLPISADDFKLLEMGFETSARSRRWLSRIHMTPPDMNKEEEAELLLKGTIPASAKPKKQVGTKRKQQATSTSTSSTPTPPATANNAPLPVPASTSSGMVSHGGPTSQHYFG